jgi:O-antigen/teichoic acid export membrane protein
MRLEILAVALSFGATSLFWLVSALRMAAADYGAMMQLQALLLTCVALFSLRTHDLVFHLQAHHDWALKAAWRLALRLELVLMLLGSVCVLVASHWLPLGAVDAGGPAGAAWVATVLLANLTVLQGASAAYLRARHLDRRIAAADTAATAAWLLALAYVLLTPRPATWLVLGVAFAAGAVRPLVLTALAVAPHAGTDPSATDTPATPVLDRRRIGGFLLGGQFTNLIKNNLLSLETLLLGRLVAAEGVAVFRVARSLVNLSTVLLNISYQKSFRALAAEKDATRRGPILRRMSRSAVKLWAVSLPPVLVAAVAFVWLKPTGYADLPWLTALAALAALPVALQQPHFAGLSLDGRFGRINASYIAGFLVLVAGCALATATGHMHVTMFLILSLLAAAVRFGVMHAGARAAEPT